MCTSCTGNSQFLKGNIEIVSNVNMGEGGRKEGSLSIILHKTQLQMNQGGKTLELRGSGKDFLCRAP